jgi:hypothetical protein
MREGYDQLESGSALGCQSVCLLLEELQTRGSVSLRFEWLFT